MNNTELKNTIHKCLDRRFLSKEWAQRVQCDDPIEKGLCSVAAEAFYYIAGGKNAGFTPYVCTFYQGTRGALYYSDTPHPASAKRSTHWWVQSADDEIIDITANQFTKPFSYEYGRGCGFQNPQAIASKRAQKLIDAVTERLGSKKLETFRQQKAGTTSFETVNIFDIFMI